MDSRELREVDDVGDVGDVGEVGKVGEVADEGGREVVCIDLVKRFTRVRRMRDSYCDHYAIFMNLMFNSCREWWNLMCFDCCFSVLVKLQLFRLMVDAVGHGGSDLLEMRPAGTFIVSSSEGMLLGCFREHFRFDLFRIEWVD